MRHVLITTSMAALLAVAACGGSDRDDEAAPTSDPVATAAQAGTLDPTIGAITPERRSFRDWRAVCGNDGTCVAIGPADGGFGHVRIEMAAGGDASPQVSIGVLDLAHSGPLAATVDGRAFPLSVEAGQDSPYVAGVQGSPRALIEALAQGQAMTVGSGETAVRMSLSGVAAALLWIDEKQGRLDTSTALIRRGAQGPDAVPAPPALPRIRPAAAALSGLQEVAALPAAVVALPQARACAAELQGVDLPVMSARLSATTRLWAAPCFGGAYNMAYALFVTDDGGGDARALTLPTALGETLTMVVNPFFEADSQTLEAFNKGRGIGDCGAAQSWAWTGQRFELTYEAEMEDCWGLTADRWPVIYRAETAA